MALKPTLNHESLRLLDPSWEPQDDELAYRVRFGYTADLMVELVRVKREPNYDGGRSGNTFFSVVRLGTPSFFEGTLKVPEKDPPSSSLAPSWSGDQLLRRTPETDVLVRAFLVLRDRLADETVARKALERALSPAKK